MIFLRKNNVMNIASYKLREEKAFSLIEVLVSLSIISLSAFYFMQLVGNVYDNMERTDTRQIAEKFKEGFVEKILLQVPVESFYSNPDAVLERNMEMPSAWPRNGDLRSAKSCSKKNECFGKIGYWVVPILHYPGLYYVTVKTSYEGKEEVYTTLVRLK